MSGVKVYRTQTKFDTATSASDMDDKDKVPTGDKPEVDGAKALGSAEKTIPPKEGDDEHRVAAHRNTELGEAASQMALFQWFKDQDLQQFMPLNIENPHIIREHLKRTTAHKYFYAVQIMEWLQIYTIWSKYNSQKPKMITREWIMPKLFSERENDVFQKHYDQAYHQLTKAAMNVRNHASLVYRLNKEFEHALEASVEARKSRHKHERNIPLYNPAAVLQPAKFTPPGTTKPTLDTIPENEPKSMEEIIANLQNKVATLVIDRDHQEAIIQEMRLKQKGKDEQLGAIRKRPTTDALHGDAVEASPRLPAPLHAASTGRASSRRGGQRGQTYDSGSDSEENEYDRDRRRRRRRKQRLPEPSPSPSPSPSQSDDESSDGNDRRRHRRRRLRFRDDRTPSPPLRFAQGSQIATLKTYDGKEGAQVLVWLRDIETAGRKFNWSDAVLVDAAIGKLTNGAKKWYDQEINLFADFSTWDRFSKRLIKHYYPPGLSASAAAQMEKLKYDEKSQLQTLYDKIRELSYFQHQKLFVESIQSRRASKRDAARQAAENTTYNAFKSKMPREMMLYVMSMKPSNSYDMLNYALEYEEETKAKARTAPELQVAAFSKNNPIHKDWECHYCGKLGHIQKDCRTKKRDASQGHTNNFRGRGNTTSNHNQNSNRGQRGGQNSYYRGRGGYNNSQQQQQSQQYAQSNYRGGQGRGRGGYRGNNSRRNTNAIGYDGNDHQTNADHEEQHEEHQQPYHHTPDVSFPPENNEGNY